MVSFMFLSILLAIPKLSTSNFLEDEANYLKPKLDRNNVVNKGIWVRNKYKDNLFEKSSLGSFIFRPTSLDADRLLQTNFDAFAENDMEETPFVPSYIDRARRSTGQRQKRHNTKSKKGTEEQTADLKISNLKTSPMFHNYPYEVAILLNNNRNKILNLLNERSFDIETNFTANDNIEVNESRTDVAEVINVTEATTKEIDVTPPMHIKKRNNGEDDIKPQFVIDYNSTNVNNSTKSSRNVYDKSDGIWHQSAPIPNINVYDVVPKDKTKPVTERGLIKVISLLTKTFKKVTKQNNDVKVIYDKINTINNNFLKDVNDINMKFLDFNSRYSDMIRFTEKLKDIEQKLINEEEYLKNKHKEMDVNVLEFGNQQLKFLAQQKQFYAIQKIMLAQNEKIHLKQSAIAKTQSEISHRQNSFARILKKTKQLFVDSRKSNHTNNKEDNLKVMNTINYNKFAVHNATEPLTVETVKLNLFSIPTKSKLLNQDDLIIKEKDKRPIDDLVYKYYFNNTFIDNLMKSKVLNNYASNTNTVEVTRNVKNKRNKLGTTLLIPITNINNEDSITRVRRWVDPNSKSKSPENNAKVLEVNLGFSKDDVKNKDPFLNMAKSFCNEIGQNTDKQSLNWCVEKALRRLQFMDKKMFAHSHPVAAMKAHKQKLHGTSELFTEKPKATILPFAPSTVWLTTDVAFDRISTPIYSISNHEAFFPDNEELESNLKQYDLTPDTEGNVYYDGSLHFSDIGKITYDSDGRSDIMPGLTNSNSHAEMNPMSFDFKTQRQTYMRKLNEDFINKLKNRKL